jgi:hypothetical protein
MLDDFFASMSLEALDTFTGSYAKAMFDEIENNQKKNSSFLILIILSGTSTKKNIS